MSLKYGKSEVASIAEVLDAQHDSAEAAARACLTAMEEVFAKRANFVVVGQLCGTAERSSIPTDDPEAIKLSLGWYSTEGDALAAAGSLWHSASTGDTFRTWILPCFHLTPTELSAQRKEQYQEQAIKAKGRRSDRLRAEVAKTDAVAEEKAAGGRGSCTYCGHIPGEHGYDGSSRGPCRLPECARICPKFKESIVRLE